MGGSLLERSGVKIAIIVFIVLIVCVFIKRQMSAPPKKKAPVGGDYTSIELVSQQVNSAYDGSDDQLIRAAIDCTDEEYGIFKLDDNNKVIYHAIAEAVLVCRNKDHVLSDIDISKESHGSYNKVYHCKYDGNDAVIRISAKSLEYCKHAYEIECTSKAIKILGDCYCIAVPYVSSVYEKHSYEAQNDSWIMPVTWSVLPVLRPYTNNDLIGYLNTLKTTLPLIHKNNIFYLDWKHDNVMVDSNNHVLISDIEFHSLEKMVSKVDHMAKSHYTSQRMNDFIRKMNTKDWYIRYENQIAIRDVLISLWFYYNGIDDKDEYNKMIVNYSNYSMDEADYIQDGPYIVDLGKSALIPEQIKHFFNEDYLDFYNLTDDVSVSIITNILTILNGNEADVPIDLDGVKIETEKLIEEKRKDDEDEKKKYFQDLKKNNFKSGLRINIP